MIIPRSFGSSRTGLLAACLVGAFVLASCTPAAPPPAPAGGGGNQPAPVGGSPAGGGGAEGTTGGGGDSTSTGAGSDSGSDTGGEASGTSGGSEAGSGGDGGAAAPTYPPADGKWAGLAAPFFAAMDQDDRLVALDTLKGKWVVVYFYPKDDTPGCTVEGTEFTALLDQFGAAGAVVFGVSADSTESHRAFREKCSLKVDLLSDPAREMMKQYGAWTPPATEGARGRLARCTFLIDAEGRVAHHWPAVNPSGHAAEVLAKLKEQQGG